MFRTGKTAVRIVWFHDYHLILAALNKNMFRTGKTAVPIVWLHDYHLMLAANTIRESVVDEGYTIRLAFSKFKKQE